MRTVQACRVHACVRVSLHLWRPKPRSHTASPRVPAPLPPPSPRSVASSRASTSDTRATASLSPAEARALSRWRNVRRRKDRRTKGRSTGQAMRSVVVLVSKRSCAVQVGRT